MADLAFEETEPLSESRMPKEFEDDLMAMRDGSTAKRYGALKSIISKMREIDSGCQGHKRVSDACMLLVIREMRDIVLERLKRLSTWRLVLRSRERIRVTSESQEVNLGESRG
jgi:hypothetical protein